VKLTHRLYSSEVFRPRPEIHCDAEGDVCIVATPWGPRSAARKAIQSVIDFLHSSRSDEEVTSPFQTMTCLSPMGNNLRIALMLANDLVFREENRSDYQAGVELLAIARVGNEALLAQIGGPHVLLDRPGLDMQILSAGIDLSVHHSSAQYILPPLPNHLLGIASTSNFSVQSFSITTADRLVLVHRTLLPARIQVLDREDRNLTAISQCFSRQSAQMPFWLGILELG
jgi:hypothetical protein